MCSTLVGGNEGATDVLGVGIDAHSPVLTTRSPEQPAAVITAAAIKTMARI
jgi:hypothetical protein